MCGFVGFLLPRDDPRPDLVAWSDAIHHRGPDQGGQATHGKFGIGTRRLSILDLSAAGSQPMHSERYIIGFNGEIYNHLNLRAELRAAGITEFASHSDTETILRGIEQWGAQETLNRLNGMYALAIWDKEREELTLARDPLGIKPLLYVVNGQNVYFGSELKALRRFTSGRISREGMALYLMFGFTPAPYSLLEEVRKIQPGEALVFTRDGVVPQQILPRAWSCSPDFAPKLSERVQQVRSAVEAAVQRQLLADVPVGLFLSGGVDSSIIAAITAATAPNLASFSIRPDNILADPNAQQDAEIAARFARSLGLSHHELLLRPDDLAQELEAMLVYMDEPVSELYFTAEVLLSRKARAAGVPVVLTGHGGDELFMGYPTYEAAVKGDRYNHIPFFGPVARAVANTAPASPGMRDNLLGAASVWRQPLMERYTRISAVHFQPEEVAAIAGLSLGEVRELAQSVVCRTQAAALLLPKGKPLGAAELFARMDMLLKVPENYNMRLDKATMAASVEARVPFQDLELIGLVSYLPGSDLMHGGVKGLLKQAFADVLPTEVLQRPKQTFQAPMLSWVRGPLAPWVAAQLVQLPAALRQGIAPSALAPQTTKQAYRTWCLGLLESWRQALGLEYA